MTPTPQQIDTPADPAILQRNLVALAMRSPLVAREIAQAQPRPDLVLVPTGDGVPGGGLTGEDALSALLGTNGGSALQLASRHHPLEEARTLISTLDLTSVATVVVLGFGLGHHVRLLSERLREYGLVVVFEPDVGLLRAVMERIDCSPWLVRGNVSVVTSADDTAAISLATRNSETLLTLGSHLLSHPPSRSRLGSQAQGFATNFTGVLKAARTHIVTTLVQTEITLRNLLQNIDHYTGAPGINDLAGRCAGRPAIVVSAGPSLSRNIEMLTRPGVRDRFVIIAAQTVLKPLLARGIRPHFVTALDHHEISRRFYEGLTPQDVEGVTLIAEPKANAAILDAFPGLVRCVGDAVLDQLLGAEMAPSRARLQPGATVAHLAYSVARFLGCDPVILVGQDLGFTDGQYYAAGAAIHNVWAGELNEFNTLEMLEWQRIARMKSMLRRVTDQQGRPIYTDEQMHTYLVQFEREFAADAGKGLTIIDATEGGVAKQHATPMRLSDAMSRWGGSRVVASEPDPLQPTARKASGIAGARRVEDRLRTVRQDVARLGEHSRRTVNLLTQMREHQADRHRVNSLITEVYSLRDKVQALETANWFVHFLNQCGTFRRLRADRAIAMSDGLSAEEVQSRQIERDISNVQWLTDAAEQAGKLLEDAMRSLAGGPKTTRDEAAREEDLDAVQVKPARARVAAVVSVDPRRSCYGTPRDLARPIANGLNALQLTIQRLSRCQEIDAIVVLSPDPELSKKVAGVIKGGKPIHFERASAELFARHQRAMAAGRLWSRHGWRGGLGNLSGADEAFCPKAVAPVLHSLGFQAAAVLGGDWPLIDPALTDQIVARYRESPTRHRLSFSQAPPGFAPMVLDRGLVDELAAADHAFASIGGLLGYIPIAPQADPIAKPACVTIPAALRDLGRRGVVDDDGAGERLSRALIGNNAGEIDAASCVRLLRGEATPSLPDIVHVDLVDASGTPIPLDHIQQLAQDASANPNLAVTLLGRPAYALGVRVPKHQHLADIVSALRSAGVPGIHVRAPFSWPAADLASIIDLRVQVLSLDIDDPTAPLDALETLRSRRDGRDGSGLPVTWIVPRLTRRDAVYEHLEGFYDACLMGLGAGVLDPLPAATDSDRIAPLPLPPSAMERIGRTVALVDARGEVRRGDGVPLGSLRNASMSELWLASEGRAESVAGVA